MIELFRAGTSHVINGITCEKQTVNEFGFEHYLEEGWFFTPEECYPEEPKPKEPTLEKTIDKALKETEEATDALEKVKSKIESKKTGSKKK